MERLKSFYCPNCGKKLGAGEVICNGCGSYLEFNDLVSGNEPEPEEEIRLQDMNISNFIPTQDEKIVRCQLCGGENRRGSFNCSYCGYLIKQQTQRDEIIEEDEDVVARIPPSKHGLYRTMGIQLYVYKLIDKFTYNCQTKQKYSDGRIETCNEPLTFIHKKCPKCGQDKKIYYNCNNYDDPKINCDQMIDVNMIICPKCKAPTLFSDIKSILTGSAIDRGAIDFTQQYFQRDFPQFMLVRDNYKIVITHQKLMAAHWWLQSTAMSVSEMLKMLATFLDAVMTPRGRASMPSIFSSFNLAKTISQVQSPQTSSGLTELLQERAAFIQNGDGNQAAPAQPTQVEDQDEDMDNSQFIV